MTVLRVIVALAAGAAAIAWVAVPEPAVYPLSALAGIVMFVAGASVVAADSIPLRRLRLATSLAAWLAGACLLVGAFARPAPPLVVAVCALVLVLVPWISERRRGVPG
jgi:hypothetical protein